MKTFLTASLFVLAALAPTVVEAQEDFRSADLGRPIRVEDAIPIHFREWEFELGGRQSREGGLNSFEGVFELKAGLLRNTQLAVEVEASRLWESGSSISGIEAVKAHLLYGLARETPSRPALAVRVEGATPGTGAVGHKDAQVGIVGIATRSVGRSRLHGNVGYTQASNRDGGGYIRAGLAADYPIGLFSKALLADVYVEVPDMPTGSRVWVDVGTRLQISNWSVVDVGMATRLDQWADGQANVELVVGFSRVFGFQPSVPPYPNPTIP